MNAGAYGSDWSEILVRARVLSRDGDHWLTPQELGLAYRSSALGNGSVVAEVEYRLTPRPPDEIKETVRDLIARRKEACGLKGHTIGGAMISPMHANFIENTGGATTADALALMAEARRRAREQFGVELEHEVRLVGPIALT